MGLPLALDGLPDKLQLNKAVECPVCGRQVSLFRKAKDSEGNIIAVCGMCKEPVPDKFLADIRKQIKK